MDHPGRLRHLRAAPVQPRPRLRLVPIVQRAQIDFLNHSDRSNAFIVDLVAKYYAITQMRLNIVNNGADHILGNFEADRVQHLVDVVTPILTGQRQPYKQGLKPSDLYTNEYIDPGIGLSAA